MQWLLGATAFVFVSIKGENGYKTSGLSAKMEILPFFKKIYSTSIQCK